MNSQELKPMYLHELQPSEGSKHSIKRLGRGIGSGHGKTSGKGHKGQNARSGGGVRLGFEGGQMPLIRRVPKRGFTNIFKKEYAIVNVCDFEQFKDGTVITAELLFKEKIIGKVPEYGLKVLSNGDVKKAFTVKCNKISKVASEKIIKAGGKVEVL